MTDKEFAELFTVIEAIVVGKAMRWCFNGRLPPRSARFISNEP